MNITEYRAEFGKELRKNESKPWFANFLLVIESEHPLKKFKRDKVDGQLLNGAPVYLNQILGYEDCIEVIEKLLKPDIAQSAEPESDYAEPSE